MPVSGGCPLSRRVARATLAGVALVTALALCAPAAEATSQSFAYSAGEQPFVIPADVFKVTITAIGGRGATGGSNGDAGGGVGGSGAWIRAVDVSVIPGTQLFIDVGGDGGATSDGVTTDPGNPDNPGGFPNAAPGGAGGTSTPPVHSAGGGGGATVVSTCLLAEMCTPIVVAGGGGGGGSPGQEASPSDVAGAGGDAGTDPADAISLVGGGFVVPGAPGTAGDTNGDGALVAAAAGQAGTDMQSGAGGAGGAAGTGGCPQSGQPGMRTIGGASRAGGAGGTAVSDDGGGGGGGGGGFFGGGGGGAGAVDACPANGGSGAGGGGGSSYAPAANDFLGTPAPGPAGRPGVTIDYTPIQSPAQTVTVSFAPKTSLTANGTDQTTITATVKDGNGVGVPGENVTLKSNNADDVIGPITDNHDGTYTATLLASTIAGTDTITATDANASVTGTAQIAADGVSQAIAKAVITDQFGNHEATGGDTIQFASTDPNEMIGSVTDLGNGSYTVPITVSTTEGTWTITATDLTQNNISGTASLATPGLPTQVTVVLAPNQLVANGTATSSATVTVADAAGDGIAGQTVHLSSTDPGLRIGTVTDNDNGTYTATLTASTTAGTSTLTATDPTAHTPLIGTATLTETAGPPAALKITLGPSQISADGHSTTHATATIVDQFGNPDGSGGDTVRFSSSDPGQRFGSVTDNHNGSYSVVITASGLVGPSSISATDSTATPNLTGLATLDQLTAAITAPVIRDAHTSHRVFTEGADAGSGKRGGGGRRLPVGTTLSFTVDQQSTIALTFASHAAGRMSGTRCVRPTNRNRHGRSCVRLVPAGSSTTKGHAGINRLAFKDALPGGKHLPTGGYTVTLVATNSAGMRSGAVALTFTIVPARHGGHAAARSSSSRISPIAERRLDLGARHGGELRTRARGTHAAPPHRR
jgi:hypothetical protein